jgi:EF-P beta-lysylation protein EpmB
MIHQAILSVESLWQKELKQSFTSPDDLLKFLELESNDFSEDVKAKALFNMRVPKAFAELMEKGNPNDPLFLQVFPSKNEFIQHPSFVADPLEEHDAELPGLLHKYKSRVLVMFRTGCAVNCRYCFRRHFPYQENSVNKQKLQSVIDYVSQRPEINEIILSGGDPLMAADEHIEWFLNQCEQIPHLTRFRIHTRLPVVLPARVTEKLTTMLNRTRLNVIVVLHINHPNEIDSELEKSCERLRSKGVTILNQAVLLKGINDSVAVLVKLSEKLFKAGVMPYYLHLLDKVDGASHFDVNTQKQNEIYAGMLAELPGFLVPKLVREVGGESSKTPVLP